MAQETRVGLVVGMGFIVCFAMILANRGGSERIGPQMPYRLFGGPVRANPHPAAGLPEKHAQAIGRRDRPAPVVGKPAALGLPSLGHRDSAAHRPSGVGASRGVIADPERFTRRRRPVPKPLDLSQPAVADAAGENDADANMPALEASPAGVDHAPQQDSIAAGGPADQTATVDATLPGSQKASAGPSEFVPPRREPDTSAEVRYVVNQGDTLTKIARRYYGSPSPGVVSAIFEANRPALTSPDAVVVGGTLRLPVVEGIPPADRTAGGAPGDTVTAAAAPAHPREPSYRLYKVVKGDLLGTIAKEQLGSSKRWREILMLNKDIFSDERHLPSGVEIRIPTNTVAVNR